MSEEYTCECCNGLGYVIEIVGDDEVKTECQCCAGTGKVEG